MHRRFRTNRRRQTQRSGHEVRKHLVRLRLAARHVLAEARDLGGLGSILRGSERALHRGLGFSVGDVSSLGRDGGGRSCGGQCELLASCGNCAVAQQRRCGRRGKRGHDELIMSFWFLFPEGRGCAGAMAARTSESFVFSILREKDLRLS